jgi:ERCC4-related helicase
MTKEDALKVWKLTYKKQHQQDIIRRDARIAVLLNDADKAYDDREYWNVIKQVDNVLNVDLTTEWIDSFGIKWVKEYTGDVTPNGCWKFYRIGIDVNGEFKYAGLTSYGY